MPYKGKMSGAMGEVKWRRINDEPFEYAIQKGPHGDEFVKLLDGPCLRRPLSWPEPRGEIIGRRDNYEH